MRSILPIILVVMSYFYVFGQTIPLEGTVRDGKGLPLAGMTVTERGTTNQVSTNQKGSFTLAVKSLPTTLVFSGVGFKRQKVQVATKQVPAVESVVWEKELMKLFQSINVQCLHLLSD